LLAVVIVMAGSAAAAKIRYARVGEEVYDPLFEFDCIGVRMHEGERQLVYRAKAHIKRGITPRCKVIIFDLNHVLGVKWHDPAFAYTAGIDVHARHNHLAFYFRPGARKLLQWCLSSRVRVFVWSTAQPDTVDAFVRALVPAFPRHQILSSAHLSPEGMKDPSHIRELLGGSVSPGNLLAFDDDPHKFPTTYRPRVVKVKRFEPETPFDGTCTSDRVCLWMLREFVTPVPSEPQSPS
jgi:hypothetical protein